MNIAWDEDIESDSGDSDGGGARGRGSSRGKGKRKRRDDEEEEEDSDAEEEGGEGEGEEEDDETETAEDKRRRLAKEYLASMQNADEDSGAEEGSQGEGEDHVSEALKKERLEKQGKYFRDLASHVASVDASDMTRQVMSDHEQSVTCVALTADESTVYSGAKDNAIIMWDLESSSRRVLRPKWSRATHGTEQCSKGEILAVAVTSDGRYVASGGRDCFVRIYDTRTASTEIRAFQGHRDAVTTLAFRRDSYSLFSGSLDRCLKHWDLNEMGYLETLFGHQDAVTSVDCWTKERPVSASSDRTCRVWKIAEETHLVFRGQKGSADNVGILTDEGFLSGGQDGSLYLWKETQKKPTATVALAHGLDGANPRWICGLGTVKMSDFAASGSYDGSLRLWKVSQEKRQISQVNAIALDGFINALAISSRIIVAGTGREHRLGRWWCLPGNKNKVAAIRLPPDLETSSSLVNLDKDDASYGDDDDDDDDDDDGEGDDDDDDEN